MTVSLNVNVLQTLGQSAIAAGVAGITRLTDPRAAAVGFAVGSFATSCFVAISRAFMDSKSPLKIFGLASFPVILLAPLGLGIFCGIKAAQQFDPQLGYGKALGITAIAITFLSVLSI